MYFTCTYFRNMYIYMYIFLFVEPSLFEIATQAMHLHCFGSQLRMAGDDAGSSAYPSLVRLGVAEAKFAQNTMDSHT